jgi:hypothetical protein
MEKQFTLTEYQDLVKRLEEINKKLSAKEKKPSEIWLDNQEVMQLLKVSRRCLQNYRDSNMLASAIIGNKLYYKMSDVEDLLNRHYRKRLA